MLVTEKSSIEEICVADNKSIKYHQLEDDQHRKVSIIKELIDVKFGKKEIENLSMDEIDLTMTDL